MSQSTTYNSGPASTEQIAALARNGVQPFHICGPECPCRAHKNNPQKAIISTGSTTQRTELADWHYGCAGSNMCHALGGVDTFGDTEPRSVTGQVLEGPFDIGTFFLPKFLSTETKCEVTGEKILTYIGPPEDPMGFGRRMVDESQPFDSATCPQDGLEVGIKLPPGGCSFFASLRSSTPRFFKDTAAAADLAIEATSSQLHAYAPDIPPPWEILGTDENGRKVISLDWVQQGDSLELPDGLETSAPRVYYRTLSAWRQLCTEYYQDEEALLDMLAELEAGRETMSEVISGHEGKEHIRTDLRSFLDAQFSTQ